MKLHLTTALMASAIAVNAQLGALNAANALDAVQAGFFYAVDSVLVFDVYPTISTSTVLSTSIQTIFACPPEKTDCPLRQGGTSTTTSVVVISTSLCPTTYVSSYYSAVTTTRPAPVSSSGSSQSVYSTIVVTHPPDSIIYYTAPTPVPSTGTSSSNIASIPSFPGTSAVSSASTQSTSAGTTPIPLYPGQPSVSSLSSQVSQQGSSSSSVTTPSSVGYETSTVNSSLTSYLGTNITSSVPSLAISTGNLSISMTGAASGMLPSSSSALLASYPLGVYQNSTFQRSTPTSTPGRYLPSMSSASSALITAGSTSSVPYEIVIVPPQSSVPTSVIASQQGPASPITTAGYTVAVQGSSGEFSTVVIPTVQGYTVAVEGPSSSFSTVVIPTGQPNAASTLAGSNGSQQYTILVPSGTTTATSILPITWYISTGGSGAGGSSASASMPSMVPIESHIPPPPPGYGISVIVPGVTTYAIPPSSSSAPTEAVGSASTLTSYDNGTIGSSTTTAPLQSTYQGDGSKKAATLIVTAAGVLVCMLFA